MPKGYDPTTPGIERYADLLRLKSFVVTANIDLTKKAPDDLAGTIVSTFATATPLDDWLRAAIRAPGPAEAKSAV